MLEYLDTLGHFLAAEEATHAQTGGISSIGVDPKALIFQVVNFAILLWILKRVAYRPILKVLENRRKTIEESLKSAREMEKTSQEAEQRQQTILASARQESEVLIARSQQEAAESLKKAEAEAKHRSEQIIKDAKVQIGEEVQQAKKALRAETMDLVITATSHIIQEKLDPEKDRGLLEKALAKESKS